MYNNNSIIEMDADNVLIYNTNLWDNGVSGNPTGICDNLVVENSNLNSLENIPDGGNNISMDPIYIAPASGDFHLSQNSPCIDAGSNEFVSFDTDFDGKIRIWNATGKENAIVDIGAFEYDSPFTANREVEKGKDFNYTIFPNPNHGTFKVRFHSEPGQKLIMKLVNQAGQTIDIRYVRFTTVSQTEQFNISSLCKGMYYMVILSEKGQSTEKILIH